MRVVYCFTRTVLTRLCRIEFVTEDAEAVKV